MCRSWLVRRALRTSDRDECTFLRRGCFRVAFASSASATAQRAQIAHPAALSALSSLSHSLSLFLSLEKGHAGEAPFMLQARDSNFRYMIICARKKKTQCDTSGPFIYHARKPKLGAARNATDFIEAA